MATWHRVANGSTAGNISMNVDIGIQSVTRTSNSNVRVVYGVRFAMATSTYTYNSVAAFCPKDGGRYYAFKSGSGPTSSGTWYYANTSGGTTTGETCPFTIDIPVSITQTSASFSVGYGWDGWTPNQCGSSSISVTFPTGATAPTGLSCSVTGRTETTVTLSGGYSSNGGASVTSSGYQYSTNGSSWTNCSSSVSGLSPNTTYYFRYYAGNSVGTSYSSNASVTTYAYPYLTSVPEFTVGNSLTIGIYNPLKHSCVISIVDAKGTETNGGTITDTTISGFNNTNWCNIWYASLPASTQGKYKARLKCTTGNVNQLSGEVNYYLNTSDTGFKPGFTTSNIINIVNGAHTDISGTDKFIKGYNSLSGSITPMIPSRSATPDYYNVSASGLTTVKKTYSSSNINFTLGNMTTDVFNITAVDKRGFSTTVSKSITLIDYNKPSVTSAKITRQNGIGTKAILAFSGKYTNWSGLLKTNAIQSIKYKIGSSGSWTALPSDATLTNSNGTWTLNAILTNDFTVTSQYNLYLQITDLLETVTTNAYVISTADAFIWKDLANKRVGIGKKPNEALDVAGDIGSDGDIYSRGNCQQQSKYSLSLSGLSTSNFYPVTFEGLDHLLDCEIMSQGASASAAYNQNHIHYRLLSRGWSDTPVLFTIMEYGLFDGKEITIGCIGKGDSATMHSVVWLRGGLTYTIWANQKPNLHTSDWDNDSAHSGSKFTVGTNLYGGTNVRTTILFTPQSTIKQGAYFNRGIKIPVDSIYPVGSIYLSATPTNPSTIFGGTWTQLKNHFLFATNATSGNKGKDAVSSHTGTEVTGTAISVDQMPSHNHGGATGGAGGHGHEVFVNGDTNFPLISYPGWSGGQHGQGANVQTTYNGFRTYTNSVGNHTHSVTAQGGGKTHNHSVSYIEVYVWQRTA